MSEHILVVDDDELVRSGMELNLGQHGFRVTTAAGGADAMRAIKTGRPDLALCDLVLGDTNGVDLMKKIHEAHPETAVILITGHGSIKNALEALRNGASDYIQKPADPEEVIHRIRTVLHTVHLRRALEAERDNVETRKRESSQQQMRHDRMTSVSMMAEGAAQALGDILRPVLNHTPAIRDALSPGSPARDLVAKIESAGLQADELLGDLHYIGTGSGGKKAMLDVAQLIAEIVGGPTTAALREARPDIKLQTKAGDNLSPVEANAALLQRAIGNLIFFSAETPGGSPSVINITAQTQRIERIFGGHGPAQPGRYVVITVTGSGPGIGTEDLDRLFEPFYTIRLGRAISGLALPLVYRVILDHGGSLDVTSTPDRGTAFTIYLPAVGIPTEEPVELVADYGGGETVLLVDDSHEHRTLATDLLAKQGYRVISVPDGRAAIAKFAESVQHESTGRIDLAVIDYILADPLDGLETYKKIIEICPRQKAVMASGFADLARLTEARRTGIGRIIQKPYTAENLTRAVREVLDA